MHENVEKVTQTETEYGERGIWCAIEEGRSERSEEEENCCGEEIGDWREWSNGKCHSVAELKNRRQNG